MNQSPSIAAIAPALVAALGALDDVTKTNTAKIEKKSGGFFSYTFANLADAMTMVRPVLAKNGLGVMQPVAVLDNGDPEVTTVLLHTSGEWMSSRLTMSPTGKDPQALGSAITFARRYALFAMLGIATEDDDGAQASKPAPAPPRGKPAASRSKPDDVVPADAAPLPPAPLNAAEDLFAAIVKSPDAVREALAEWRGTRPTTVKEMTKDQKWFRAVEKEWGRLYTEHLAAGEES